MNKKSIYQKPMMEVVELRQRAQLLDFSASRTIYTRGRSDGGSVTDDDEVWGD